MAEFEELRINVKLVDEASGQLGALKRGMSELGGVDFTRKLEGIHKQVSGVEQELKKLMLNFATGGPSITALANFAKGIGPIGIAAAIVYETLKNTVLLIKRQSEDLLNMAAMAKRVGESTAQYIRTMEIWQRAGVPIERAGEQWERFVDAWNHMRRGDEEGRGMIQELLKGLGGEQGRRAEQRLREILDMANPEQAANALRKWYEDVGRFYQREVDPARRALGPSEQRRMLRTFGIPDLDRIREAFTIVSEQEAADMDRMITAAAEFELWSIKIEQDWNRILQQLGTMIMEGPAGPILRLIDKAVSAEAKRLESSQGPWWWELLGMLPGNLAIKGIGHAFGVDIWGGLGGIFTGQTKPPGAELPPGAPGNMAVPLMSTEFAEGQRKQLGLEDELIEQLKRFNNLLAGDEKTPEAMGGLATQLGAGSLPDVKGNPAFHNAPMGGAAGESNPMRLPAGIAQPGGGAPAEARRTRFGQASLGAQFGNLAPSRTALLASRGVSLAKFGAEQSGRGFELADLEEIQRDVDTKKYGETGAAMLAAKRAKEAKGFVSTMHWSAGIPMNPEAFAALPESENVVSRQQLRGYGFKRFGQWEKGGSMGWQQRTAQSKQLEAVQRENMEMGRQLGLEEIGKRPSPGPSEIFVPPDLPAPEPTPRAELDRSLANEAEIEPRGNLNVSVKAPNGTRVKAEGDGMFKGNVSLDRQMQLPTLQ